MDRKTKQKTQYLWLDQYGDKFFAATRKELVAKLHGGKVSKMYIGDGQHIGYVIGQHWLTRYAPAPFN